MPLKRLVLAVLASGLVLMVQPGCGARPGPATTTPAGDTAVAAQNEICETLPPVAPAAVASADTAQPKPGPGPAPKPEPAPAVALPRLWEFGRGTCIPCKTMKTILDPLIAEYAGKVDIRMINIDDEPALTKQYRIQMIPTQVFIDPAGNEVFRHVGVYLRDSIVGKFTEYGWE